MFCAKSVWLSGYSVADEETQSGAVDWEVAAVSPGAPITIHYYSALPVCKCFLTTRDSRPSSLPASPICGVRRARLTVNARLGKKARRRNIRFLPSTCQAWVNVISRFYQGNFFFLLNKQQLPFGYQEKKMFINMSETSIHYQLITGFLICMKSLF